MLEFVKLHWFVVCEVFGGFWAWFQFWDLGRWFEWFLFECSSYSKLKFLKFLEASKLGSNRASRLLNLDLLQLFSFSPSLASFWNVLGRLLFIGVWGGWATRGGVWLVTHVTAWLVLLCHRLHARGLLVSSLTHVRLLVSSLTHVRLLVSSLTCALMRDWFLQDTWQISFGFWVVIAKSSSNTRCFVIGCILWTW